MDTMTLGHTPPTHLTAQTRRAGLPRGLAGVQFVAAVVDGMVLSSITVHAVVRLSLPPETVGAVLAGAAAAATFSAPVAGMIADRVGLRRAGTVYALATAAALAAYVLTRSLTGFAVGAVVFASAQTAAGAARHAIAVAGTASMERTRLRAVMHTVLNAGFGCGTALGVLVLAGTGDVAFNAVYGLGIALAVATAVATARLGDVQFPPWRDRADDRWVALRDRPFAAAVALACMVQLTMPILSILLPVWVVRSAGAVWLAGGALALNTVLVILLQRRWAARLVDARTTAESARLAASAVVVAGLLLSALPQVGSPLMVATMVTAAVVALTAVEVAGGAAVWQLALQDVNPGAEGRYQSAFAMSANGARVLGALVALPLILQLGGWGWLALAAAMAASCLAVAHRSPVHQ